MMEQQGLSAKERRRRDRTVWRTGLLVSALLHLLILFGWRGSVLPQSPFAAAGPKAGDNRAAAGSMQALNVRTPPAVPTPIVPPPIPIPADVEIEPVEVDEVVEIDPASILGDAPGPLDEPGLELGTGRGDGGDSDQGLYRLEAARPRGMVIPPQSDALRGVQIQVWVFVDEQGRVVADSTRLDPPTRDRGLNRQLVQEAADWLFYPARQDGVAVASWFPYRIGM